MKIRFFAFFILLILFSFHVPKETRFPVPVITIDIQPFSDLPSAYATHVLTELKKIYPKVALKKAVPLPSSAYYAARKRYRADSLIEYLGRQTAAGHVAMGLTSKDISTTKDQYKDWGVMGLGFCPGNSCVASSFRLGKTEIPLQLFKVVIHELGHTQGLNHCEVKTCFMRDAEGKNPTNEEKEFCPKCKKVLESAGWKFE